MPSLLPGLGLTTRLRGAAGAGLAVLLAALLVLQVHGAPAASAATALPTTYQDQSYPVGPSPTEDKPQSKLWFNDGSWWALMRTTAGVTIHRLTDHVWVDTGTVVDERQASTGDALWQGGKLYVASRVANGPPRAVRFSYDPATDTYALEVSEDVGSSSGSESISIDRDSLGRLWITYTQGLQVYVSHSAVGDDTNWTTPMVVPNSDTVSADDISAIIAFGGKIGVMWSDQAHEAMRFAVHADGSDDTAAAWTIETVLSGTKLADDHINLKSLLDDDQGRIYAAVKTSRGDAATDPQTDPSLVVLQRSATGTWTSAVAATVGDKLTRPQLALDRTNRKLYVVMSSESGGSVFYKATTLGSLSFPSGSGTPFIQWTGAKINDASTTKQPVDATTGLVVLASDSSANRYFHGEWALAGADVTAPSTPAQLTATPTSGTTASLSWPAATDDVGVTDYRVFRDGIQVAATTATAFSDAGLTAGTTYAYTVAAADLAGNLSARSAPAQVTPADQTRQGEITFVGAATATGSGTSTSVGAPAGVAAGDVLVAVVSARGAPVITAPAGWTQVRVDTNSTTMRQAVFVRTADTANASTWTLNSAKDNVVQVLAYRGVDTANPVVDAQGAPSSTATVTSPTVSSVDGGQVVTLAGIARTTPLTPAAPVVERSEITNPSTASYKISADAGDTIALGATSGPYSTAANGSSGGIGQTVALRPGVVVGGAGGGDTTPPTVPTGLTAAPVSTTSIALSWTASTDTVGVTGYRVYRDGVQVGSPTGTSFTDTGLTAGTSYGYAVDAVDAAGNASAKTAIVTAATQPAGDTQAPTAPTGLRADSTTTTSVALSWTASTDAVGVTGYRVYRDDTLVGSPTGTSFTDTGLTPATTYGYAVAAVDAAGNVSPRTATLDATTAPPAPPSSTPVTFVSAATATGATTSTTVAAPAGATTGDVLVAVVSIRGNSKITPPAGWTLVRSDSNGTTMQQAVYVRAATTSNSSTWTFSPAKDNVVQVLAYRGVDTAHPVIASAGAPSTTAVITSPGVAAVAGARVVTIAGTARTATLAPGSPLVERSEITTAGTAKFKVTADAADTTAAGNSAGPYTTTASGAAGGIGQTVTLRPRP